MKTTLRKRIKEASKLLNATYETTIVYGVATDTQNEDSIIEVCPTLPEARAIIFGLNEEYKKIDGYGIRLFIIPQVIDADSGELVTKKNIMYYRHDSKWVKNFKKEQISRSA